MKVEFFSSWEEALQRLDEARQVADARVQPWQTQLKPGDCFLQLAEQEELLIFGEVLETYPEKRMRHYRFCRCYSVACPEGEMGDVHISVVLCQISREDFEQAQKNGWAPQQENEEAESAQGPDSGPGFSLLSYDAETDLLSRPRHRASGKPFIKLREERGPDYQAANFAQAKRPESKIRGENMSTRAMIAVQYNWNGPFALHYRHCDGYPTGLGMELVEGLKLHQDIDALLEQVGAEQLNRLVSEPKDAFLKVQGDLEWIYAIRVDPDRGRTSLSIYKTSNPYTRREFAFHVWHSYVKYLPRGQGRGVMRQIETMTHIALSALGEFEKAGGEKAGLCPPPASPSSGGFVQETASQPPASEGAKDADIKVCNECGRSVAWGSGWFVNRIPDFNTVEERRAIGRPFPEGDFICAECDQRGGKEVGE